MELGDPLEQGSPLPGCQDQFAAVLTAKLDSLTEAGGRGSPADLAGEYDSPDSMETQGDVLGEASPRASPGVASISELDLTNSPNSLAIPDCEPDTAFSSTILPTFGPLPDPNSDPPMFDDTLMSKVTAGRALAAPTASRRPRGARRGRRVMLSAVCCPTNSSRRRLLCSLTPSTVLHH